MAKIETWFTQDLNTAVKPHSFPGEVFNNDSLGNLIGVEVTKDGEPFELTGSVNGYCVLSNGETIPVAGTRSGNKASIVLPQTAYSVRGVIKITLKLTNGNETTTLLQVVGAVDQSVTGNMVNPGSVVQDWSQQIAAALQELQDAENNFVRVDTDSQGLTETKKSNGRTNIDAASVSDVDDLKSAIVFDIANSYTENVEKTFNITKGSWRTGAEIVIVRGHAYTVQIAFSNPLAKSFYTEINDSGTAIVSRTFGVQTTGGTITFTATNNSVVDFRYLTADTANTEYTITVSSSNNLQSDITALNTHVNSIDDDLSTAEANLVALSDELSVTEKSVIFENANLIKNGITNDFTILTGSWKNATKIPIIKGHNYTVTISFQNQLAKSFYASIESNGTVITSLTIGVQSTSGKLAFTATSDDIVDVKYLTTDTANIAFELSVFSTENIEQSIKDVAESVDFNTLNIFGISNTITSDNIVKGTNTKLCDALFVSGLVYNVKVSYPVAPNNNVIIRFINSESVERITKVSPSGWQEVTFDYICENTENGGIWYLTNATNVSEITIEIKTDGTLEKEKTEQAQKYSFFDDSLKILETDLTIETANQLNNIACNITHGRSYQCIVTSTGDGNRFGYSNNTDFAWIEPMIQQKLSGYIFNFIAAFDADTFAVYTTTTATVHVELYERRENIPAQSLRNHDAVFYTGDTKNNGEAYICNAVSLDDGTIIAARGNGTIIKIALDGVETQIADFDTADAHFRLMFFDRNGNLYVSPASFSRNNFVNAGLYRMAKGTFTFTKVLSLYNNSTATDSTIWTMTEDDSGNLYAGEYSIANANPKIYKSTNGGTTWTMIHNFVDDVPEGRHIHWVEYSPWQKSLYAIVGEINTIFKSSDGGTTWKNLNIALSNGKGCGAITTPNGLVIGSDSDSVLTFHRLENDDKTVRLINTFWANMCFSIRRNNLTGDLYAFGDIEVSARDSKNYPPLSVLSLPNPMTGVEQWHSDLVSQYGSTLGDAYYNKWLKYYNAMKDKYQDDAIVSHHYGVFISRDGGLTFEVLKRFESADAGGINNAGLFFNGECLCGVNGGVDAPVIISTGRQKYVVGGCDFDGQIFVRTNTSTTNAVI